MTFYDYNNESTSSQLFYVGGQVFQGGFTSGGAKISSSEPGGRSYLEINPSLQVDEWDNPFWSWLLSMATSGSVFRVILTETPQLYKRDDIVALFGEFNTVEWEPWGILTEPLWDNDQPWLVDDLGIATTQQSLIASQKLYISDPDLKHGHVLGYHDNCYMIKEIQENYVIVIPPLRQTIESGEVLKFKPVFLGEIVNGGEIRNAYEAANGHGLININKIVFSEFIK